MEYPPIIEYCAVCSKCLSDEPVLICCEICRNKICNDCRAIDRKRTIIATSLTKETAKPSGRLLSMLGSKLSVLSAFRSGLSKGSFEFDEQEEEETLNYRSPSNEESSEFDKYFDKPDKHHLDVKNLFKHNKIEKQLSFQHSERRGRLSYRGNSEGGSLDIDISKETTFLSVPIDQQKQSRSDSQLNRTNAIEQSTTHKENSSEQMKRTDLNNNEIVCSRSKIANLNRFVSLDDRAITQTRKSPVHTPLERSTTVDQCESALERRSRLDNIKEANDFILSICVMCAKINQRAPTGGEWMKKITRSASEKLKRSGSITRTLINRSNLIKAQSHIVNQTQNEMQQTPNAPQHRHSTDAGASLEIKAQAQFNDSNNNSQIFAQQFSNNQMSPCPSSQQTVTKSSVTTNLRKAHAQLSQVNSSPLPSTAHHRLHQPVYNQTSQPVSSINSPITYKSPPPPPNVTPCPVSNKNLINQPQQAQKTHQTQHFLDNNELNQANYYLNQNFDSAAFQEQYNLNLNAMNQKSQQQSLSMQAQQLQQQKSLNALANLNQQPPYITPKYVRGNFTNKLPTIDCSKISSMNPLPQQQQLQTTNQYVASSPAFQQFKSVRNPPSSGSSLEANSPRSGTSQGGTNIITTINSSSSNSSPHPVHQVQSNFSTSVHTTNMIGNIGNTSQATNLLNNSLGVMGKVLSDLVSSDTRAATIQELRETVYRKVSTRFRSSSTSSSSTSSSCSLSNYPSLDTHNNSTQIYYPQNIHNVLPQQQQPPKQPSAQQMYHSVYDQANFQPNETTRTGRQLPHIPGQQTYYQFHSQLSQQQSMMINDNHSLESSPSPKTPLNLANQRGNVNQSKFANALNNNVATAFRFPPNIINSTISQPTNVASNALQHQAQQPPHSPLKNQSSDEYPCSSTTVSSHRSRSSSSDIYEERINEEQPTSPVPISQNVMHPTNLGRHNTLQAGLKADRTRRASPLRKQRAIHLIDAEQQAHFNQMSANTPPIQQQDEPLIIQSNSSAGFSPLQQSQFNLPASSVKTQRSRLGFPQAKLQQAKSFTMLQQQSNKQFSNVGNNKKHQWDWRENRLAASSGLFRCKSACETNTISASNLNEEDALEATVEPRTGCVFRKMTVKRRERSYHALDVTDQDPQINQPRKLSFNPELSTSIVDQQPSANGPMTSVQLANFFKEPVHKSHSEDSKTNRHKNDAFLHNGSSGSDPLIHRKLGAFLPHISVSDYSANSRRPSAIEDNIEMNENAMLIGSRFNSNNLLSSEASNTSTSRTSLHDQLSTSSSNTPSNLMLSNSSTFDDRHQISPPAHHYLRQPSATQRRNSSENKLNPNTMIYRQSRSLSNSAHSQEIEDQLLEKSFYSQPTLTSKNVSIDRLYPVLNNTKKQSTLFLSNQNTYGEILVSIYYNNRIQTLEIKVREARNLVPVDGKLSSMVFNQIIKSSSSNTTDNMNPSTITKSTNPYVKTYLLPDRTSGSKRKTRAKVDTLNPVFNDLLSYIVDSKDVHNRTLWLTVWHWDKFSPNQFLGELILSLDNINLSDSEYKWYPLKRRNQANKFLIDLSLKKSWPQLDSVHKNEIDKIKTAFEPFSYLRAIKSNCQALIRP